MVDFVSFLESPENGDGVLDRRLPDEHGLEPALQRGVLLHVLAVFVQGGGAYYPELAPGQHGLEHVGGVHRSLGRSCAHDGVHLVDEGDDLAFGIGDLLEHGLQTLLELAPILGAGHHPPDVESDHPLVFEALGHVARDYPLGQPFHDGGLAHPGFADEDRVVLGPPGKHLDHSADLVVSTDHGVELAPAGELGEVATEPFQSLVLLLGVGILSPLGATYILEDLEDGVAADTVTFEEVTKPALVGRETHEHVLGRDVGVAHLVRLGLGRIERLLGLSGQADLRGPVRSGEVVEPFLQFRAQGGVACADPLQDRHGQAALLVEQSNG